MKIIPMQEHGFCVLTGRGFAIEGKSVTVFVKKKIKKKS